MVEFILTSCAICLIIVSYNTHKSYKESWGEDWWKDLSTFTKFTKLNTYYGGMSYDNTVKKSSLLWKSS